MTGVAAAMSGVAAAMLGVAAVMSCVAATMSSVAATKLSNTLVYAVNLWNIAPRGTEQQKSTRIHTNITK